MKHLLYIIILRICLRITYYHINIILSRYHRCFHRHFSLMSFVVGLRPPVSHHNTIKSPFLTKNSRTQIITSSRPEPVHASISRHHRTRTALFYRNLKTFQINLTQSSLRDHRVRSTSSNLLIITTEMLDRTSDSRLRHSLHLSCTNPACKNRILRNILKITSVQWISVNIHTRSKKRINLIQTKLLTSHLIQCTTSSTLKVQPREVPFGSENAFVPQSIRIPDGPSEQHPTGIPSAVRPSVTPPKAAAVPA